MERNTQPSPVLFNADGTAWVGGMPCPKPSELVDGAPVGLGPLPFLRWDWWPQVSPLPPGMHYYTDSWVTAWLADIGVPTVLSLGYAFDHSWSMIHRGAGWPPGERQYVDKAYYEMAMDIVRRGRAALQ